jgi:hypothetical protein
MKLVTYTCPTCGAKRKLKFRQGLVNTNKDCHSCAGVKQRLARRTGSPLREDPLYMVWGGMKQRCYYKAKNRYKDYGGRGIRVDEEWRENFPAFKAWMESNGYHKGMILDRINVNGNYSPSNCRLITQERNGENKRDNVITAAGAVVVRTLANFGIPVKLIAALYGIKADYVSSIKHGHVWNWATMETV